MICSDTERGGLRVVDLLYREIERRKREKIRRGGN